MERRMSKKGFAFTITSALFIIIILGAIIGLASFIFSDKLRWVLIGIGIIIAGIWLLGQVLGSNKVTGKKVFPVIIVLLLGVGFIAFAGDLQSIVIGEGIYVAEKGRLECREEPDHETITKWADQNYEFTCGDDYEVDECRVYATCEGTPWYNDECGGGGYWNLLPGVDVSGIPDGTNHKLIATLRPGESIEFTDDINNAEHLRIDYEFNPYRLYTIERGGAYLSSSEDCCLSNQYELSKNQFERGDWDCLEKGGVRNYFLNYEKIYGSNVIYNYNGRDVICSGNTLYEIDETQLADGTEIKFQGSTIKSVECCPHVDDNCDSEEFEFVQTGEEEQRECYFDYQCINEGNPYYKSGSYYQQECISGSCQEVKINEGDDVECLSDATCRELYGDGYGCDLTYDNFGNCIEIGQIEKPNCGDGICQRADGENSNNCPEDCDELPEQQIPCEWYETSVPAGTTEDCGVLDWKKSVPLVDCEVIEYEASCKTAGWVYALIAGGVIIILGLIAFYIYIPKNKSKRRKK